MAGRIVMRTGEALVEGDKDYLCAEPEVVQLGGDVVSPPTLVVRVAWADPGQVRYGGARGKSRPRRSTKSRGRKA